MLRHGKLEKTNEELKELYWYPFYYKKIRRAAMCGVKKNILYTKQSVIF